MTINEPMPPEVGGIPIVDGAHRLAAYYASVVDLIPRLEEEIGWLLVAVCGAVSTLSDVPESGLYTHVFKMSPTDYLALKWLTVRRVVPGPEGGADSGLQAKDTRIASLMLNFAAAARLTGRIAMLGREPSYSDDVSGWTWAGEPEGPTSIPVAPGTGGYFKIPDFQANSLPSQLVRVTLGNMVSQPNQEFVIGSPYPDDFASLYRNLAIEADYKWEDEDLYLQIEAAGGTGASIPWSPTVFEGDFAVREASPANISGKNYPYSIEVAAERVIWTVTAAPEIAGVNILRVPLRGMVARPASGDPFTITVVNTCPGYIWPS